MSQSPFDGATRDPIALLEQLIGQVGGLKSQMDEVKQDLNAFRREVAQEIREVRQEISEVRQELKQEISEVRQDLSLVKQAFGARFDHVQTEIAKVGSEMFRFASAVGKEQETFKGTVDAAVDRKLWLARHESQDKYAEIERRVTELEEAERRRKEGKGA